jgi:Ferritin-like domain
VSNPAIPAIRRPIRRAAASVDLCRPDRAGHAALPGRSFAGHQPVDDNHPGSEGQMATNASSTLNRRTLLRGAAMAGLGLAAGRCASPASPSPRTPGATAPSKAAALPADTVQQIFTAALIAEDLATTFYYNGLIGQVIQDPALAGPEGTALTVFGSTGNVGYLRSALAQEISHADLMRGLIGQTVATADPVQTFYFPRATFDDLDTFLSILDGLENAFVGAYLAAIRELTHMLAGLGPEITTQVDAKGAPYSATQLAFSVEAAASILGVEAEHRALGRVIGHGIPANNVCYEQRSGVRMVWTGSASAVAALGNFVQPGGEGFSSIPYKLGAARQGAGALAFPCTTALPA